MILLLGLRFNPGTLLLPKEINLDFPFVTKLLAVANREEEEEGTAEAAKSSKLFLTNTKIQTRIVQCDLDEFSFSCCLRFTLMFRISVGILVVV